MLPYLRARAEKIHEDGDAVSMELHGQRSVRQGKWKLLWLPRPMGSGHWALYDLERAPAEQTNLATSFPERVGTMAGVWNRYADEARLSTAPSTAVTVCSGPSMP